MRKFILVLLLHGTRSDSMLVRSGEHDIGFFAGSA